MEPFAPDAVWDGVPGSPPIVGRDAIRQAIEGFVQRMTVADLRIVHLAVVDDVVLTERVDHFAFDGVERDFHVMGAMEVANGKLTAWRDYLDPRHGTGG